MTCPDLVDPASQRRLLGEPNPPVKPRFCTERPDVLSVGHRASWWPCTDIGRSPVHVATPGLAKRQVRVHLGFGYGASRARYGLIMDIGSWSSDKTPAGEVRERPNRTHC